MQRKITRLITRLSNKFDFLLDLACSAHETIGDDITALMAYVETLKSSVATLNGTHRSDDQCTVNHFRPVPKRDEALQVSEVQRLFKALCKASQLSPAQFNWVFPEAKLTAMPKCA